MLTMNWSYTIINLRFERLLTDDECLQFIEAALPPPPS